MKSDVNLHVAWQLLLRNIFDWIILMATIGSFTSSIRDIDVQPVPVKKVLKPLKILKAHSPLHTKPSVRNGSKHEEARITFLSSKTIGKPVYRKTVQEIDQKSRELQATVKKQEEALEIPTNIASFEKEYLQEYLRLYDTLKTLCLRVEQRCHSSKGSRDVYALMALYSQQREIIADIRSIKDLSEQVHLLIRHVLQPYTSAIAQSILDMFYHLKKIVKEVCPPEDLDSVTKLLDNLMRDQGKQLQQRYYIAETELFKQLTDDRSAKIAPAKAKLGTTRL